MLPARNVSLLKYQYSYGCENRTSCDASVRTINVGRGTLQDGTDRHVVSFQPPEALWHVSSPNSTDYISKSKVPCTTNHTPRGPCWETTEQTRYCSPVNSLIPFDRKRTSAFLVTASCRHVQIPQTKSYKAAR